MSEENDQESSKLHLKEDAQKEVHGNLQLDKCTSDLTVVSTVSEMLDQGDVTSVMTDLSAEDSVLHGSSVLNETEAIASSSDLESSPCLSDTPVSADLLSDSSVINSTVGLLQQPVVLTSSVLPCVLTHVQGTSELLASELQERGEAQEELLMVKRDDREVLEPCVVVSPFKGQNESYPSCECELKIYNDSFL